jgi:formiminotetrahydrofolate cyclodeaminase
VQFLDLTVSAWLEELGERGPAPGGGSAAAMAGAMGAALIAMAARLSNDSWPEAGGVAAQATALRSRLAELAQADAEVYTEALRVIDEAADIPADRRDYELGLAFERAAEIPLTIAATAADVALLGAAARERVEPAVQADLDAAIALASAAAQAGARLVEVNLAATKEDPRVDQAGAAAKAAAQAMRGVFPPA